MRDRAQVIPSIDDVTSAQIQNALIIVSTLSQVLLTREGITVDTEAATSASATFIRACNVLDVILDDRARWSVKTVGALELQLQELYRTQAELNASSEALVVQNSRPSFLLKPSLNEERPGVWVAKYGKGRNALTGEGSTPHEAMLAFDIAYFALQKEYNQNGQ